MPDPTTMARDLRRAAGIAEDGNRAERAAGETIPDFQQRRVYEAAELEAQLRGEETTGGDSARIVMLSHELANELGEGDEWSQPLELRFAPGGNLVHRPADEDGDQ